MYITKITVEFEVETQSGPVSAVDVLKNLIQVPAVKSAVVTQLDSTYVPVLPETEHNSLILKRLPIKLR